MAVAALWILVLHPVLQALRFPILVLGPLDWSAHLATALLILANLPRPSRRRLVVAALISAVALDLDHLPHLLGADFLTAGTPRPYPHSLATAFALAGGAIMLRAAARAVALGAALGVLAHLARDLATADGVALFWPLSSLGVRVPFWLYAAFVGALATRAWLVAPRRGARAATPS
ncbi:MAG: metal-dependent hydrolase [Actinobacteria bacterium]|nr:metal-dependent hydrolase [Actinomycetota bacterium]